MRRALGALDESFSRWQLMQLGLEISEAVLHAKLRGGASAFSLRLWSRSWSLRSHLANPTHTGSNAYRYRARQNVEVPIHNAP